MRFRWIIIPICWLTLLACSTRTKSYQPLSKYHDIDLSKIDTNDYLIISSNGRPTFELGQPFAFVNKKNDTIIPAGKYDVSWTDTLKTFAIVSKNADMIAIDRNDNILFEVFSYDNGPDYLVESLFRVLRDGKIGYANQYGEVVIPCQYDCGYYFENGKAKVTNHCQTIKDGPYSSWQSNEWYFIDKNGFRLN